MSFKSIVIMLSMVMLVACSDDSNGVANTAGGPKIRVVNSVYKTMSATQTVAIPIDYMIDSAAVDGGADVTPADFDDIPANGISNVTSGGVATDAGYEEFETGVHSYVLREADSTSGRTTQLYINSAGTSPFLPRLFLTSGTYHTLIASGTIPVSGLPAGELSGSANEFRYTRLVDDPFPPSSFDGVYQARFRVINAAPYTSTNGKGSSLVIWVTAGSTLPTAGELSSLTPHASAGYRAASAYLDVTPGTYGVTMRASTNIGSVIVYQQVHTFAAGEVRSLILQNNISSFDPATYTPSASNHKVTNILDQRYR